jgi:hypothetical protein
MNDALAHYAEVERVMHVSGYWYPISQAGLPETFFLRLPSSWGWATWERAWKVFEKKPEDLLRLFNRDEIREFNLEGANDFWEQVVHNLNGKANTWAIFWYAAIFRKKGLCLYPSQSFVQNKGTDGSGKHCLVTSIYDCELSGLKIKKFTGEIEENNLALQSLKNFYRKNHIGKIKRFIEIIKLRIKKRSNFKP